MICVIDLEATCWTDSEFQKENSRIIEIGAVLCNETLQSSPECEFQAFVKPSIHPILSDYCKELTHITQENIDGAKPLPEVVAEFTEWLGGPVAAKNTILASWGAYDCRELESECKENKIDYPFISTVHLNIKNHYATKRGYKPGGLGKAVKGNKIEFVGPQHRALTDAKATLDVLRVVGL